MVTANILVCHSFFPERLFASIPQNQKDLWFVFYHGCDDDFDVRLSAMTKARGGCYFSYRKNRGLARSWNEGLHIANLCKCDISILLNDDLFFYDRGYELFVSAIKSKQQEDPDMAYMSMMGLESGSSPLAGQVVPQMFACCAITPAAIDRVGYFDESFFPAYFEDFDYHRRVEVSGMHGFVDPRLMVEHARSSTSQHIPTAEFSAFVEENRKFFVKKWGSEKAVFTYPFNDPSKLAYIPWDQTGVSSYRDVAERAPPSNAD